MYDVAGYIAYMLGSKSWLCMDFNDYFVCDVAQHCYIYEKKSIYEKKKYLRESEL